MKLPTGTVTFLFTDVEGSSKLLNAHPAAYREAVRRHHDLLAEAVRRNDGVVFETLGDAVCASFERPTDAVQAALDGQLALAAEPWGETPITVRMGLHLGEVELQGAHYFGIPLYRCGRVMSAGHGQQVVLSEAVAALVRESLPQGARLKDLGEHRLKDLQRPEHLFQLCHDALPAELPPLRSLEALPNNLPIQATPFVGRDRQLGLLTERLRRADVRLLTLTGPGGTGKTRLALQGAAELLDEFLDGVFFVPLAPISNPDLLVSEIAQTLEVRETGGQPLADALKEALRSRRILLVLDNFEQLLAGTGAGDGLDPARTVTGLLATAPHLKILVTSRAPLRLYGEHELPVPPLALPDRRDAPSAAHVGQFEAVTLFVQRAQAARPDFIVVDENAPLVAEICHRLDGLPLAIELAAARLRALPLRALLDRLEHRLPLLTGGARDLPARQQTLRNAIAWSYDLLTTDEQTLFCRMGVFHGCTLEAAEDVCAGAPPTPGATSVALAPVGVDVLDGVTSLVEKSLLKQEETEAGQPWYVILETVREFALERLAESGEEAAVKRRHTLYYLRLVESMDADIQGPHQVQFMARLEQEHDNYRDALDWCQTQGYADPALRLALGLWWFWYVRGHASEGRGRLRGLLARFPEQATSEARALLRARVIVVAGRLATMQGDLDEGRRLMAEGFRVLEEHHDLAGMYAALQSLGAVSGLQGDYEAARGHLERSIEVARELGDPRAVANALANLGNVALDSGDNERACRVLAESLALFEQVGDARLGGLASGALAVAALELGDLDQAHHYAQKTVDAFERAQDVRGRAVSLVNLASVEAAQGNVAAAHRHLVECLQVHREIGDHSGAASALEHLAALAAAQGHAAYALRAAGAAAALRDALGELPRAKEREKLAQKLEPARAALGEAAAAEALAAGRALSLAEAVSEALAFDPAAAPASGGQPAAGTQAAPATGGLSPREREVAVLIAQGCTNRQIAERLVITEGTAASHVVHILDKLGFSSRTQVGVWMAEQGLHGPPAP